MLSGQDALGDEGLGLSHLRRSEFAYCQCCSGWFPVNAKGEKFNFLFDFSFCTCYTQRQAACFIHQNQKHDNMLYTTHSWALSKNGHTHPQQERWVPRPKPPASSPLVSIAISMSLLSSGLKGRPDFMMWLLYWGWSALVAPSTIQSVSVRFWPMALSLAA